MSTAALNEGVGAGLADPGAPAFSVSSPAESISSTPAGNDSTPSDDNLSVADLYAKRLAEAGRTAEEDLSTLARSDEDPSAQAPVAPEPAATGDSQSAPTDAEQEALDAFEFIERQFPDLSWMREKYQDDPVKLLHGLGHQARLNARQAEELAQLRNFRAQAEQYFAQYQRGQEDQPPQSPAPAAKVGELGEPYWEDAWLSELRVNEETGQIVGPPEKVQAYEARKNWLKELTGNTSKVIVPLVEKKAAEAAQRIIDQRFAQFNDAQGAEAFLRQNAQWMFHGGNPQGELTPAGRLWGQVYLPLVQSGAPEQYARAAADQALSLELKNFENARLREQIKAKEAVAPVSRPNAKSAQAVPQIANPANPTASSVALEDETFEQALIRNSHAAGMSDQAIEKAFGIRVK